MIRIDSFSFTYESSHEPAINNLSLTVEDGECLLLTGHTGCGKSTLLLAICGLIPHVTAGRVSGTITVDMVNPASISLREMIRKAGIVFQDPGIQIFMPTVEEEVLFGCERLGLDRDEMSRRCDEALDLTGLAGERKKAVDQLSGGMTQRLAIASIYAMDPAVFLFDEPMADLDERGREGFLEILVRLKRRGKTVVIADHRTEYLAAVPDRTVVLKSGAVMSDGDTGRETCLSGRSRRAVYEGPIVVSASGLSFSYKRDQHLFEDLHFDIHKGRIVALTGDNGSGKTTLLKLMTGLLRPTQGSISMFGMVNPTLEGLIGKVGFLFQNPDDQLFESTVEHEILFGPRNMGKTCDVDRYLALGGLSRVKDRHPQELSRGQRQLVATLSVLAMEPDILLLDEPTTGLDEPAWRSFFSVLEAMAGEGKTIIYSTHSTKARGFADMELVLSGTTVCQR